MNTDDLDSAFARAKPVRSHDRTMLASLGFADADKKDPRHDLACQYLCRRETGSAILKRYKSAMPFPNRFINDTAKVNHQWNGDPVMEFHLQKGDGKFATTVGFIDVLYNLKHLMSAERQYVEKENYRDPPTEGKYQYEMPMLTRDVTRTEKFSDELYSTILLEIKIAKAGIGDVIRQLNLYRSYSPSPSYGYPTAILVAPWDITESEYTALQRENYDFVRLGNAFAEWAKSVNTKTDAFEI